MEFDLLLKSGSIVDTANATVFRGDVGIKDGVIAAVGNLSDASARTVIDAAGKIVAPGFIDAHVHIESSMASPREFAKAVILHGTTAVIADPHEIVNVGGSEAMDAFLDMCSMASIDIFSCVPSSVPATPFDTNGAGKFTAEDMAKYADRDDIAGLGEVMCYPQVFTRDKEIMDKISLFRGKTIDGHTAGMASDKLKDYACAGIENDHECADFDEAKARIDAGMNVYIREGSAAKNLDSIVRGLLKFNSSANECEVDKIALSRFAFCTDDKHLSTIDREGHIDYNVRRSVELGMRLADAVRIAAYNPCVFYQLKNRGEIKAGYKADIALLSDEKRLEVELVIKDGIIVAKNRKPALNYADKQLKTTFLSNSVKYKNFTEADFDFKVREKNYAISLNAGQLSTNLEIIGSEDAKRANLLAVIERHGKNGNCSFCRLLNYGVTGGAVATSVSHDSHNVIVVGDNPSDMAAAVNRLKEIGGGYVVASGDEIAGGLPLPIAGLMSDEDYKETERSIARLEATARTLGINEGIDPFTTLSFVALPVIPHVRLLDTGLFDVDVMKFLPRLT